jgi:hypothetical protein
MCFFLWPNPAAKAPLYPGLEPTYRRPQLGFGGTLDAEVSVAAKSTHSARYGTARMPPIKPLCLLSSHWFAIELGIAEARDEYCRGVESTSVSALNDADTVLRTWLRAIPPAEILT